MMIILTEKTTLPGKHEKKLLMKQPVLQYLPHLALPYLRFLVLHVNPKTVHKVLVGQDSGHNICPGLFSRVDQTRPHLLFAVKGKA